MARIISFLNPKGGVTKTTTSMGVSAGIKRRGFKNGLCESDFQLSIGNWYVEGVTEFDVIATTTEKAIYSIPKALKEYDYIVIDGLANNMAMTAAILMVSDLVIVPVAPSPMDYASMSALLAAIEARQALKPLDARFLITKKKERSRLTKMLREELKGLGLPVMKTQISDSEIVKYATAEGKTIYDDRSSAASKPRGEIDVLTKEILEILNG